MKGGNIQGGLGSIVGIGNVVSPRKACMTASDFADKRNIGSGDLFPPLGQSPTSYWPDSWRKKREEGLKWQREHANHKPRGYGEELPMLVFSEDVKVEPKDKTLK